VYQNARKEKERYEMKGKPIKSPLLKYINDVDKK
jgi:hypothetical protein